MAKQPAKKSAPKPTAAPAKGSTGQPKGKHTTPPPGAAASMPGEGGPAAKPVKSPKTARK